MDVFVSQRYPKDASGRWKYDKTLTEELDTKLIGVLRNICKNNPPATRPTPKHTKAELIDKRVFCDFI